MSPETGREPRKCTHPHCDAPEMPCNLGEEPFDTCRFWEAGSRHSFGAEADTVPSADADAVKGAAKIDESAKKSNLLLPWTGNTLGKRDLEIIASRNQPLVVGLIGPDNSGKTTLISIVYLLASQGKRLGGASFAGSYTLEGWESLADNLRWHPGDAPNFPPHTSRAAGRLPGLLHLALRNTDGEMRDVLFTDAPGEWFAHWTINRDATEAEGARWVQRNADVFLLLADSEALAGESRGAARDQLRDMARRLSDGLSGRRVAVVWSKADVVVPNGIRDALRSAFDRAFGQGWEEFSVTIHPRETIAPAVDSGSANRRASSRTPRRRGDASVIDSAYIALADWILSPRALADWILTPRNVFGNHEGLSLPALHPSDPFLAFRGR